MVGLRKVCPLTKGLSTLELGGCVTDEINFKSKGLNSKKHNFTKLQRKTFRK